MIKKIIDTNVTAKSLKNGPVIKNKGTKYINILGKFDNKILFTKKLTFYLRKRLERKMMKLESIR